MIQLLTENDKIVNSYLIDGELKREATPVSAWGSFEAVHAAIGGVDAASMGANAAAAAAQTKVAR